MSRILSRFLCVLLAAFIATGHRAVAQGAPSYIRDAEIEETLRIFYTPIFRAAGLDPSNVHVYIINDQTLNSFVAGGQNVFINTGTITRSQTPNQLIGIVAHETGHIAGGHLFRTDEALKNASIEGIIATVVGAAASVLGHNPGGVGAAMMGGEGVGLRSFFNFSIAQEATADQAGMTFLDRTHQSSRGLLEFFQILQQDEMLAGIKEIPYLRTHPLTSERVTTLREHVEKSPWSDVKDPPEWIELHKRMKEKLAAFLDPPSETIEKFPESDTSVAARYARAIAYYRVPELKKALDLIDGLIKQEPDNPYFHELKGQMLFENGRIQDAVAPYKEAVRLKPEIALLRVELAQVEIETGDQAMTQDALTQLKAADKYEDRNPDTWRFLAIAYGRTGDMPMSTLSLAEQAIAEGDDSMARHQSQKAMKLLPYGSPGWLRAQDIQQEAGKDDDHN